MRRRSLLKSVLAAVTLSITARVLPWEVKGLPRLAPEGGDPWIVQSMIRIWGKEDLRVVLRSVVEVVPGCHYLDLDTILPIWEAKDLEVGQTVIGPELPHDSVMWMSNGEYDVRRA